MDCLWKLNQRNQKSEISESMYRDFYRFISNSHDNPFYTLHFSGDSPLRVQAVFFFPEQHFEKYGLAMLEPGVSLYCRKVLIQPKLKGLLPEYLRFIKGLSLSSYSLCSLILGHTASKFITSLSLSLSSPSTNRLMEWMD